MRDHRFAGTCGDLRGLFQLIPILMFQEHAPAKRVKTPRISPHLPADFETPAIRFRARPPGWSRMSDQNMRYVIPIVVAARLLLDAALLLSIVLAVDLS